MRNRSGSVLVKAAAGVLLLGIAGAGAHRLAGGGCLMSLCHGEKSAAAPVTLVSSDQGDCPMRSCSTGPARFVTTEASYFEEAGEAATPGAECDAAREGCDKQLECDAKPEAEKIAASGK